MIYSCSHSARDTSKTINSSAIITECPLYPDRPRLTEMKFLVFEESVRNTVRRVHTNLIGAAAFKGKARFLKTLLKENGKERASLHPDLLNIDEPAEETIERNGGPKLMKKFHKLTPLQLAVVRGVSNGRRSNN